MRRIAILLTLIACTASPARAQEAIALVEPGCDGTLFRAEALRSLLALELADGGAQLSEPDASAVVVTLRSEDCGAETGHLEIVLVRTRIERRRVLELDASDPDAHARLAALAIAELVVGTRPRDAEPAAAEPAAAAPTSAGDASVAAPAPSSRPAAPLEGAAPSGDPAPERGWLPQVVLAIGGSFLPTASTGLGSVRAGMRVTSPGELRWTVDATVRGATGIGAVDLAPTRAHALSLDLAVLATSRSGSIEVGGGLEAAIGASWLWARDDTGSDRDWVDPLIVLAARATLGSWVASTVVLTVDVRAGWTVLGAEIRTGARAPIGMSGPVLGLDLGVAIDPG